MNRFIFSLQRFGPYGTTADDTLQASVDNSYIAAYGGDDSIYVGNYDSVTVDAGSGDDTVTNYWGWYASINGYLGDDIIYLNSGKSQRGVTVKGGTGDDIIYGDTSEYVNGIVYQFTAGDGNDLIYNYKSADTISLGGDYYTRSTVGSNVVISMIGGGATTLYGASDKTINIANGTWTIANTVTNNYTTNKWVYGTSNNDTINNYAGGATILGNSGNDSIYNSTSENYTINSGYGYVTIDGGDGNDTISSYDPRVSINGGAGDDSIYAYGGSGITVKGGTGNDKILGSSSSTRSGVVYQFTAGDGYDTLYNYSSADTISLGGDYYTRTTVSSNVVISIIGGGAMTLDGASGKTVNIYNGIQTIANTVTNNYTTNKWVYGTSNNDTINNYAGGATILGNSGNDSIYNSTNSDYTVNSGYGYVTIDGGDGSDTIESYDPRVSINGGAGNDLISLRNSNFTDVTIKAGAGNDTIYGNSVSGGVLYQYKKGDGDDKIYNYSTSDTISISGSTYTTTTSGDNILVKVANSGTMTLVGAKGKTLNIKRSGGDTSTKYITNYNKNSLVSGSSYADTAYNYAGGATVLGKGGNDYIYNSTGSNYTINNAYGYVTIDGGGGNDTIYNYDPRVSINGGEGADKISLYSSGFTGVTINAGKGNDTIYSDSLGGGVLYQYKKGDGNDIIYSYNAKDSVSISGSSWSTTTSGNNVLLKVANSGTITLNGAKGKTLNIYPAKSTTTTVAPTPTRTSVTPQDVIKKFMKSLDTTSSAGVSALNQAIRDATGGYFQNINAAISQMVADCRSAGNATTFLKNYCGIDLSNTDTGAISGADAGTSTVKGASAIVPESGNVTSSTGSSFTANGLTVQLAMFDSEGKPHPISYSSLANDTQKYMWRAFKTWWAGNSLSLISQSYGSNYGFSSSSTATTKTLYFGFKYDNSGTLAETIEWFRTVNGNPVDGKAIQLAMWVNTKYYDANKVSIGDVDGKTSASGAGYLDRTLAHELTHAVMYANVNYSANLPQFIMEGMAELTHGIDDERTDVIEMLAANPSSLQSALALTPGTGGRYEYASGYMFLRYLAKQGSQYYPSSTSSNMSALQSKSVSADNAISSGIVSVKGALLTVTKDFTDNMLDLADYSSKIKNVDASILSEGTMIIGNKKANSISAGSGKDTIFGNTGDDKIYGNAGSDVLYGDAGNDKIYGNKGNDTLNGGTGNDTLTGGDGADVFLFSKNLGKDFITDYTPDKDKIKLVDVEIIGSSVSGSNVVLKFEQGDSITLKDCKGEKITVIDKNGKSTSKKYTTSSSSGGSKTMTLTNSSKSAVTLSSAYANVSAAKRTKAIKITGNSLDNSIKGGKGNDKLYGQAGSDSLWGGAGNDSLWGGKGNDTFIYKPGEGKDTIFDYKRGDMLQILDGTFSKSKYSNGTLVLTVDSGSVTFKDITTSTTFNINDTSYKISGSKLVKK